MTSKLPTVYQQFIHKSRYARWLPEEKRREEWHETVGRYFDFFEKHLEKNSFFNSPRTVTETVEQLREHGWATRPLDVSKVLTKMAFNNEISKASIERKTFYSTNPEILIN